MGRGGPEADLLVLDIRRPKVLPDVLVYNLRGGFLGSVTLATEQKDVRTQSMKYIPKASFGHIP